MKAKFFAVTSALLLAACAQVVTTAPGTVGINGPQYMTFSADKFDQSTAAPYDQMRRDAVPLANRPGWTVQSG
jgi:hypothetical protein